MKTKFVDKLELQFHEKWSAVEKILYSATYPINMCTSYASISADDHIEPDVHEWRGHRVGVGGAPDFTTRPETTDGGSTTTSSGEHQGTSDSHMASQTRHGAKRIRTTPTSVPGTTGTPTHAIADARTGQPHTLTSSHLLTAFSSLYLRVPARWRLRNDFCIAFLEMAVRRVKQRRPCLESVLQGILLSSEGEKLNSMNLLLYMAPVAVVILLPATMIMEDCGWHYHNSCSKRCQHRLVSALQLCYGILCNLDEFLGYQAHKRIDTPVVILQDSTALPSALQILASWRVARLRNLTRALLNVLCPAHLAMVRISLKVLATGLKL